MQEKTAKEIEAKKRKLRPFYDFCYDFTYAKLSDNLE